MSSRFTKGSNIPMLVTAAKLNGPYYNDARFDPAQTTLNDFGQVAPLHTDTECAKMWYQYGFGGGGGITSGRVMSSYASVGTLPIPLGAPTATISIKSDNANDTAAGVGARTVKLTGLALSDPTTGNLVYATETLTLNGTTEVPGTVEWFMPPSAECVTFGQYGQNLGIIWIEVFGGSTVVGKIPASAGVTQTAHIHVPAEATGGALITFFDVQVPQYQVAAVGEIGLVIFTLVDGESFQKNIEIGFGTVIGPDNPVWVPPSSYVYAAAKATTNNAYARVGALLMLTNDN